MRKDRSMSHLEKLKGSGLVPIQVDMAERG
ncbi:hypothetical protein EV130_109279 [Rhizobium azibense]|uniref:Uncharacterized protein n=1 Tax=Rhizobium azibense TaxID=1136135 RepID=A0A4R3RAY2_9HYPH|nr:hypothetical protein EV130_109279 [Rhizobium azibense]TCU30422.1 hypothetical protein EV129_13225 [Rhizobium azibense]